MKHNKKRNSTFVREALILEITEARLLNSDLEREREAVAILKKFFGPGTEIQKECSILESVMECDDLSDFQEVLRETEEYFHRTIDQTKLRQEKDQLISQINKNLGPKVFSNFVTDYRKHATVHQIFSNKTLPKVKRELRVKLKEGLAAREEDTLKPLDELEFKVFCEEFNREYSDFHPEQKKLLSLYIDSISDDLELKAYLSEEISRLKETLSGYEGEHQESVEEVLDLLHECSKAPVDDLLTTNVLRMQQLARKLTG